MKQLQAGLDFYGFGPRFVPLVAPDAYKAEIDLLKGIASQIEGVSDNYERAAKLSREREAALRASLVSAEQLAVQASAQVKSIGAAITDTQDALIDLTSNLIEAETRLIHSDADFQDAVSRASGGCTFGDVINCATSLIKFGSTAYLAAAEVLKDVKGLSAVGSLRDAVKQVKLASKDVGELTQAYRDVRGLVQGHSNEAKIGVTLEDYDAILSRFAGLKEAAQYRQAILNYLEIARARNDKALDLAALSAKLQQVAGQVEQLRSEAGRLSTALAQGPDAADAAESAAFVTSLLSHAKWNLIRALYGLWRANEYLNLTDSSFSVSDGSVAEILSAYGVLVADQMSAIEERNRGPQLFQNTVILRKDTLGLAFDEFCRTGRLTFPLRFDPVLWQGYRAITVSGVDIRLPGVRTDNNQLSIHVRHSGSAAFIDRQGQRVEYSHRPRTALCTYDLATKSPTTPVDNNLVGDLTYAALSPFSAWTIDITGESNVNWRLDRVNAVELHFTAKGYPRA